MSGDIAVSVVVPTRDRTTRLLLTLTALGRQTLGRERFEVVLVDDAPHPGAVAQVLSALPPGLPVRTADTGGRGAAHARNTGAREARGELLLFLDDDTLAGPGLLEAHLAAHAHTETAVLHSAVTDLSAFALTPDPHSLRPALVGARGRRIEPAMLPGLDAAVPLLGPRRSFIERTARKVIRPPGHPALRWLVCIGTATSVRRTLFDRVGGFDEHYGDLWGGEDLELGLRLAASGAGFDLLDPVSYHLPTARRDTDDLLPRFWRRVAARHGTPRLADVGTYLTGQLPLPELAKRLTPPTVNPPTANPPVGLPTTGGLPFASPAAGSPSFGSPGAASPAVGSQSFGGPAVGSLAAGSASPASLAAGRSVVGSTLTASPSLGSPSAAALAVGSPAAGSSAVGSALTASPLLGSPAAAVLVAGSPSTGRAVGSPAAGSSAVGSASPESPSPESLSPGSPSPGSPLSGSPAAAVPAVGSPVGGIRTVGIPSTGSPSAGTVAS
ncbi:glycosyltransferase family 2 protein [Streptomyces sp. YKOK-I1]